MKIKPLAKNRKARFEYDIQKTFEAGIVLTGTEVKSIRSGRINLAESYCRVDEKLQVYLLNAHISHYDYAIETIMNRFVQDVYCYIVQKYVAFMDN